LRNVNLMVCGFWCSKTTASFINPCGLFRPKWTACGDHVHDGLPIHGGRLKMPYAYGSRGDFCVLYSMVGMYASSCLINFWGCKDRSLFFKLQKSLKKCCDNS
jgi:hypothetical protein